MKKGIIKFLINCTYYKIFWTYKLELVVLDNPLIGHQGWEYHVLIQRIVWRHRWFDVECDVRRFNSIEDSFETVKKHR